MMLVVNWLLRYLVRVCCGKCKAEIFCPLIFFFILNWKDHGCRFSVAEHLGPARPTSVALFCCLGTIASANKNVCTK